MPFTGGGIAFSRSLGGDAHKIFWTGTSWHIQSIQIPIIAAHIYGTADSGTFYLLADGSAYTLTGNHLTAVRSSLERVTEWYPTAKGFLLGGRKTHSRTGLHYELEYHDHTIPEPRWRTALTGDITIASSAQTREFYVMGSGPVRSFTGRGAGNHLDSAIAAVGITAPGQLIYLDHSGHLV
jgi:hypothetical protein